MVVETKIYSDEDAGVTLVVEAHGERRVNILTRGAVLKLSEQAAAALNSLLISAFFELDHDEETL